jgi:hypothetical protein
MSDKSSGNQRTGTALLIESDPSKDEEKHHPKKQNNPTTT